MIGVNTRTSLNGSDNIGSRLTFANLGKQESGIRYADKYIDIKIHIDISIDMALI